MTDLNSQLNSVQSNESFLERLKRFIPGYSGYVNRDNSREIDSILRNKLASDLSSNHAKLKNSIINLSSAGKLFETPNLEKLDKKLQNSVASFKSASRGFSGAFDVVKIKEDKLNQLYSFDSMLVDNVNKISSDFAELETNSSSGVDTQPTVNKINSSLNDLLAKFEEREQLLRSL